MAVLVEAPARRPRSGGIKAVVGDFTSEQRLAALASGGLVWEDSICDGGLSETRAGCYDLAFPLQYDEVVLAAGDGVTITFTREPGQMGVAVSVDVDADATPEEVTTPWPPTAEVTITAGGETIVIGEDGTVTASGEIAAGTYGGDYETESTDGGYVPDKEGSSPTQFTQAVGPFALYAGVTCWLGGDQDGSYESQAVAKLDLLEERGIEAKLFDWAATQAGSPASSGSLIEAIAQVENAADKEYAGQPLIIMSRYAAQMAFQEGALDRENGQLVTGNGNPVLAVHQEDADENVAVYAVGWPRVFASPVRAHRAPDLRANRDLAIAERVYAIAVDCDFAVTSEITTP